MACRSFSRTAFWEWASGLGKATAPCIVTAWRTPASETPRRSANWPVPRSIALMKHSVLMRRPSRSVRRDFRKGHHRVAFRGGNHKPLMRFICLAASHSKLNDCEVRRYLDETRQGLGSESDVRVLSGADQSYFQPWCFCRDNTPFMTKRTCLLQFRNERLLQGLMNCLIAQHFPERKANAE